MIESSNLERNTIVVNEPFLQSPFIYLIALGGVQSSIVDTFHDVVSFLGFTAYWPYFFLSVYMAKKFPPKGLVGAAFCIVIGSVLAALIRTYGKRFI